MLWVTGKNTTIIKCLSQISGDTVERIPVSLATFHCDSIYDSVPEGDRFVLCAGLIRSKSIFEQGPVQIAESLAVNMTSTIALIEAILEKNNQARIVVMGSMSGIKGSYDTVYAAAKAGLHQHVINRKLKPKQQLVAIAPGIIKDSGMTQRRADKDNLRERERQHPKKRFLTANEVAHLVHYLLYTDKGYITNTIINMTGGEVQQ